MISMELSSRGNEEVLLPLPFSINLVAWCRQASDDRDVVEEHLRSICLRL